MDKAQFEALFEIMNKLIELQAAKYSSDGGLIESVQLTELKREFVERFCNDT